MSASLREIPSSSASTLISYDPMRGEWLVLSWQRSIPGMPVWTVVAADVERARAEKLAGLHDSPVRAWLVQDPVLGWRRGGAWVHRVDMAIPCDEADARLLHQHSPRLQLFVIRANGLVTCPDVTA